MLVYVTLMSDFNELKNNQKMPFVILILVSNKLLTSNQEISYGNFMLVLHRLKKETRYTFYQFNASF